MENFVEFLSSVRWELLLWLFVPIGLILIYTATKEFDRLLGRFLRGVSGGIALIVTIIIVCMVALFAIPITIDLLVRRKPMNSWWKYDFHYSVLRVLIAAVLFALVIALTGTEMITFYGVTLYAYILLEFGPLFYILLKRKYKLHG